jgi:hypothetical protein
VLLARLLRLLLFERDGRVIARQFAEIGEQRFDQIVRDLVTDIDLLDRAGEGVA